MAYFEVPENPDYNDRIEKLTPDTEGHADVWNVIYERIIQNIAYIHNAVNVLKGSGDGSVTKLIAEEVAKIIADAPEDFDTLKEISDWISEHQDGAAAMNTAITDLKNTKLDKTAMADSAVVANRLKAIRSDSDLDVDVFEDQAMWIREQKANSPNIPTENLYHVINVVGMGRNRTQLALGVTTNKIYYRRRESLSSWQNWKEIPLLTNGVYTDILTVQDMLRIGKPKNAPFGVELAYNSEGGNVAWYSPDGTRWEFDTCDNFFRLFNHSTFKNFIISKYGEITTPSHLSVNGDIIPLSNYGSVGTSITPWYSLYSDYINTHQILFKDDAFQTSYGGLNFNNAANVMYQSAKETENYKQGIHLYGITNNIRLSANRIFFDGTASVSANSFTYSDCKVKKFSDDIGEDKDKLLELFDFIQVLSYKYKYANNDKLDIGISAQELRAVMDDLDIDIDKYNILDIYYNYMLPRGNGEEDMKYYTEFYTISYNCLYNLSLMKIKRLEEKYNRLESDIELLKRKVGA